MRTTRDSGKIAAEERTPLVDVFQAIQDYGAKEGQSIDSLFLDGMHPNDEGHKLIADLLLPKILVIVKSASQN